MRLRVALVSLFLVFVSVALAPSRILGVQQATAAEEDDGGDDSGEEDEGGGW